MHESFFPFVNYEIELSLSKGFIVRLEIFEEAANEAFSVYFSA